MRSLFWDLDGTLVDSRRRLYELFCYLTDTYWLSFEQYWTYKDMGYNQRKMLEDVLHYDKESPEQFSKRWHSNIEKIQWLRKDTLKPKIEDLLKCLEEKKCLMYVVTNRQSYENTIEQLKWLGILHYFEAIYNTALKYKKSEIVLNNVSVKTGDVFIGDSSEDMVAAAELGIIYMFADEHSDFSAQLKEMV